MQISSNTQKEPVKIIPKDIQKPITTSWIFFFVFLTTTIIYYFLAQPELPLFYTVANKEEQLAPKIFLFLFPAISVVITITHFFIARLLQRFSAVLLKLFLGTTLMLQILLGFALARIIFITL